MEAASAASDDSAHAYPHFADFQDVYKWFFRIFFGDELRYRLPRKFTHGESP
jgi:hypothetical protein